MLNSVKYIEFNMGASGIEIQIIILDLFPTPVKHTVSRNLYYSY